MTRSGFRTADLATQEEWARGIPELSSRPEVIAYMAQYPKFRRLMMRAIHDLIDLGTRLRGSSRAVQVLNFMTRELRRGIDHYDQRTRVPGHVHSQSHAVLVNVRANAIVRSGHALPLNYQKSAQFVARKIPDWMMEEENEEHLECGMITKT